MTDDEIVAYYASLLIKQYAEQPKALATVAFLARMAIMNQLPLDVMNAYNLDTAVGVQLDVLGKYIGIGRSGYDFDEYITLTDAQYRQVLKMKIVQNNYGSSLADIQNFLHIFFEDQIFIFDYLNMRIGYFIDTDVGDLQLVEFFIMQGLLPRPMGVQLSATIYSPSLNFFGFRTYAHEAAYALPFNTYDDYQMDRPFLQYENLLDTV